MTASLNEKLRRVKWGKFKLGDLFDIKGIKQAKSQKLIPSADNGIPYVVQSQENNMVSRCVDKQYLIDNNEPVCQGNAIVLGVTLPAVSYQKNEFGASQVITARASFLTPNIGNFIAAVLSKYITIFSYQNKPGIQIYKDMYISLPKNSNDEVDFNFMESFIAELEAERVAELSAYLTVSGLDNYELSKEEAEAIKNFSTLNWDSFNLKDLYGKSTRGKRLKSEDRISGTLPFVTAGEANEGVSDFIGNKVEVFEKNTTTIDMFGSAKYRNYQYGGDDHVAIVHTENLPMKAAIFVTSACHKAAHTGKFDYGHNFYAKDADALNIMLPAKDGEPDYQSMGLLISAIQKLVIKDVVQYADREIAGTKQVIE